MAHAGMPSYQFSDVARMRIEDLSFFVLVFLLCALGVKWLWNLLAKDFPRLPRLRFGRSLALTTLLGLFTLLVLSMISGARELLTPGAWRRQGSTYRLTDPTNDPIRRKGLEVLRAALWDYAGKHDGKFPREDFAPEIPDDSWKAPDEARSRYLYVGGFSKDTPAALLAAEPDVFEGSRFALLTTGEITRLTTFEIGVRLAAPPTP
jgi:hypothetical protein